MAKDHIEASADAAEQFIRDLKSNSKNLLTRTIIAATGVACIGVGIRLLSKKRPPIEVYVIVNNPTNK